jgi:hypothetical protein
MESSRVEVVVFQRDCIGLFKNRFCDDTPEKGDMQGSKEKWKKEKKAEILC